MHTKISNSKCNCYLLNALKGPWKMIMLLFYSDLQKHESSCLLSDRFWCISPEPSELQKIFLPLLASLFEELSDRKGIFQI